MLELGTIAPDFTAPQGSGGQFTLSHCRGSNVFGRVMDDSTGCGCKGRTATDPGSHTDIQNFAWTRLLIQPLQHETVP